MNIAQTNKLKLGYKLTQFIVVFMLFIGFGDNNKHTEKHSFIHTRFKSH